MNLFRGYGCWQGPAPQGCSSTMTGGEHPVSECFGPKHAYASATLPLRFTPSSSSQTSTVTESAYLVMASMIEIVWQSTDRDSPASTNTPASASFSGSSSQNSGLYRGYIPLIVILPLAVVMFSIVLFYLVRRQKKQRKRSHAEEQEDKENAESSDSIESAQDATAGELHMRNMEGQNQDTSELHDQDTMELHDTQRDELHDTQINELYDPRYTQELEGTEIYEAKGELPFSLDVAKRS